MTEYGVGSKSDGSNVLQNLPSCTEIGSSLETLEFMAFEVFGIVLSVVCLLDFVVVL